MGAIQKMAEYFHIKKSDIIEICGCHILILYYTGMKISEVLSNNLYKSARIF